jgi:hypothetical protein
MRPATAFRNSTPRNQQLIEDIEAGLDEQERWRKINAAYHDVDHKFMRFPDPVWQAGARTGLQHGLPTCGTGNHLTASASISGLYG